MLIHPAAIIEADHQQQMVRVNLDKTQIEASPDIQQDAPVTMQMESQLNSYYGWDPYWGRDLYSAGVPGLGMVGGFTTPSLSGMRESEENMIQVGSDDGDPHLRSMASVTGYHIHASDGDIGHVKNFLLDDATWVITYLIVDTTNWWGGVRVLISPFAVEMIDWDAQKVLLNVTRAQVKASPVWDPEQIIDDAYRNGLHRHYGWPGWES